MFHWRRNSLRSYFYMKQTIICRTDLCVKYCNYFAIYSDSNFHRKYTVAMAITYRIDQ